MDVSSAARPGTSALRAAGVCLGAAALLVLAGVVIGFTNPVVGFLVGLLILAGCIGLVVGGAQRLRSR